jgi:hypothetical protein
MKYLKIYKLFLEDGEGGTIAGSGDAGFSTGGNAYANATIAGMGNITNAIVGDLPGVPGVSGSGDVTVVSKRCKRKKGNPIQVTDLRDLDEVETNKIEESAIISGDEISEYDLNIIRDSLLELNDIGFNLIQIHSDKTIDTEKINICLEIKTNRMNKGIRLHYLFNSDIIINKNEKILGGGINGDKLINHMLNEFEQKIVDVCDYDIHQLMNMLNCYTAIVDIFQDDYCSTDIFKIEIDLIRNNEQDKIEESLNIKPIRESYYSKQEYFQEIQYSLEKYNIRPIVLNNILDMYENDILKNWEDGISPKIFVDNIVKELELDKGGYMNFRKPIGNLQTTIKYL